MAFNLGTPKTASGFTLPTTTPTTNPSSTGFQFGNAAAGDAKATKPSLPLFNTTPTTTPGVTLSTAPLSFGKTAPVTNVSTIANTSSTTVPPFGIGSTAPSTSTPTLNFSLNVTTTPSTFFPLAGTTSTTALTSASSSLSGVLLSASSTGLKPAITASSTALTFGTSTSSTPGITSTAVTGTSALPSTGTLTFAQLEDAINKWTIDLEEQGKHFGNQAKQINAWDRLLITNGEKILSLSNGIERVKQQQQQLDQELDFVLAQQKELEDLIKPLEKELAEIPVTDLDRNHTYQMAENLNTQLKQMSEDLKEIVEHLNESNKNQELSNPITQISRILSAHMNSLQWIDRQTTKISTHLDQIVKLHDMNRRNHEINLQKTYE